MGFCIGKRGAPPWPPIHAAIHKDEKDRFGLPVVWSFLAESDEERKARISAAERLIKDAFETAAGHLGHDKARRLFAEVSKKSPKGKQADQDINRELLALYDSKVKEGRVPSKSIPRILATRLREDDPRFKNTEITSITRRICRVIKRRDDDNRTNEETMKMFPPTFLTDL